MQSVTSMFDCTHGPKKDCHACIVGELVAALEGATEMLCHHARSLHANLEPVQELRVLQVINPARAALEKAKLIEDCIPIEEAEEASRG